MVFGYMYDVDSSRNWIAGSDRGAYFHQDCWDEFKGRVESQPSEAE
jgi:hypothetical protein